MTRGMIGHEMMSRMSTEMRQCINNCTECHAICVETTQHCLEMGGPHVEPAHLRTLIDCAQICQTSADFMLRMSPLHPRTCGVCAEACIACAESCEQFADDQMMQQCAAVCRRCAESCRQMAGQGMAGHAGMRM